LTTTQAIIFANVIHATSVSFSIRLDVQAIGAYTAGMNKQAKQYTLRNVPPTLDQALRRLAYERETSLNDVLLEALAAFVEQGRTFHDLDKLVGTWEDDPDFDQALAAQSQVDEDLWK
jgi:hypothetical protein